MKKWGVLPLLIALLVLTAGCPVPVVAPEPEEPAEEITAALSPVKGWLKLELSLPRVTY